MWLIDNDTV